MSDRQHILDEIRRTAKVNGGLPLGHRRFEQETGIRYHDWFGRHWARWGDAVTEAGLSPNILKEAFSDDDLFEKLISFIRELGRFPAKGDLLLRKRADPTFPNDKVLNSHFGSQAQLRQKTIDYANAHGLGDIEGLCGPGSSKDGPDQEAAEPETLVVGFVYLLKSGRHYKIGKTNSIGRREYELAIQLPEKLRAIHAIKTDDPEGIEQYWHKRFASKRGNGEWFDLSLADIQAFKRRKFM